MGSSMRWILNEPEVQMDHLISLSQSANEMQSLLFKYKAFAVEIARATNQVYALSLCSIILSTPPPPYVGSRRIQMLNNYSRLYGKYSS